MNELPAGTDAVLLEIGDDPAELAHIERTLRAASASGALPHVSDIVPAATTILIQFEFGAGADSLGIARALRRTAPTDDPATTDTDEISIGVHYDGADLNDVARLLAMSTSEVIAAHTGTRWRVQFMGFAPGFGYLVPEDDSTNPLVRIGRRSEPRTRVPVGSVALAAGYSAVYPRSSPGGWNLLGHTEIDLWDASKNPPSLLTPGALVRFVDEAPR